MGRGLEPSLAPEKTEQQGSVGYLCLSLAPPVLKAAPLARKTPREYLALQPEPLSVLPLHLPSWQQYSQLAWNRCGERRTGSCSPLLVPPETGTPKLPPSQRHSSREGSSHLQSTPLPGHDQRPHGAWGLHVFLRAGEKARRPVFVLGRVTLEGRYRAGPELSSLTLTPALEILCMVLQILLPSHLLTCSHSDSGTQDVQYIVAQDYVRIITGFIIQSG